MRTDFFTSKPYLICTAAKAVAIYGVALADVVPCSVPLFYALLVAAVVESLELLALAFLAKRWACLIVLLTEL